MSSMRKLLDIVNENQLQEFAPGDDSGEGRWYTDDQLIDIVGPDWAPEDDAGQLTLGQRLQDAQAWLDDQGYSVVVEDVEIDPEGGYRWKIYGEFYNPRFAEKDQGLPEGYELGDKVTWYYSNHYPKIEGTVVGWKDGKFRIKAVSPLPGQEHTDPTIYAVPKNNIVSHTKKGMSEGQLNENQNSGIVYATGPRKMGTNDVNLIFKNLNTNKIVAWVVGNNDDGGVYEIRINQNGVKKGPPNFVATGNPQDDSDQHLVYKLGKPGTGRMSAIGSVMQNGFDKKNSTYYGQPLEFIGDDDWWSFLENIIGDITWEDDAIDAGYVDRLDNGDLVFVKQNLSRDSLNELAPNPGGGDGGGRDDGDDGFELPLDFKGQNIMVWPRNKKYSMGDTATPFPRGERFTGKVYIMWDQPKIEAIWYLDPKDREDREAEYKRVYGPQGRGWEDWLDHKWYDTTGVRYRFVTDWRLIPAKEPGGWPGIVDAWGQDMKAEVMNYPESFITEIIQKDGDGRHFVEPRQSVAEGQLNEFDPTKFVGNFNRGGGGAGRGGDDDRNERDDSDDEGIINKILQALERLRPDPFETYGGEVEDVVVNLVSSGRLDDYIRAVGMGNISMKELIKQGVVRTLKELKELYGDQGISESFPMRRRWTLPLYSKSERNAQKAAGLVPTGPQYLFSELAAILDITGPQLLALVKSFPGFPKVHSTGTATQRGKGYYDLAEFKNWVIKNNIKDVIASKKYKKQDLAEANSNSTDQSLFKVLTRLMIANEQKLSKKRRIR